MQRVLDIDLDFFCAPVVYYPQTTQRPDPAEHSVIPTQTALRFLQDQCALTGPTPGFLTETHDQLFGCWRAAVQSGVLTPPFHVTHVDAHADLGVGDAAYMYLMEEFLHRRPDERLYPRHDQDGPGPGLAEGNFLLFAIACQWIGELTYVFGEGGGSDELNYAMQGFDLHADHVQLAAVSSVDAFRRTMLFDEVLPASAIAHLEPAVPYRSAFWDQFRTEAPYDMVCLTRSPLYAPSTADALYDEIARRFITALDPEDL
ncbi:UPF0489 family protein [Mycobacteroides abscessus]|uniref:UPF0489 family protein n=1 Tax=Mycobacteroides abscessus TaxID=36809 RepID=UPI0009CA1D1A|nr:UPF0489 family protein [Mycobacteroides abscessus]SLF47977.1 UPF0489 domain [Mycobacteroides abscessus subsp. abscessus]